MVADFLALAVADVHFGLGDSSFLGNAAAAGMGVFSRVGDRVGAPVCKAPTPTELEALSRHFAQASSRREQAPKGHVEL